MVFKQPALTHVCMWKENKWVKTTAEEVSKLNSGETISAASGLLMCELCGQYVTLTRENIRGPYFKHSSEEQSKDCPERTSSNPAESYRPEEPRPLPLKLVIHSPQSAEFQIGFVYKTSVSAPKAGMGKIEIQAEEFGSKPYRCYSIADRLIPGTITYLSVGSVPAEKYQLTYPDAENTAKTLFWPKELDGVSKEGTFFDFETGKKLPVDADVVIKHPYLLVNKCRFLLPRCNLKIEKVCDLKGWYIHKITAERCDENIARFFLNYHLRLTDAPAKLYPIWPVYLETPCRILSNGWNVYFFMTGEGIDPIVFPHALVQRDEISSFASLLKIASNERQQIVCAGRLKNVLAYTYLWRADLSKAANSADLKVNVHVSDNADNEIASGEHGKLPRKECLWVSLNFDGTAELVDFKGSIINKYKIKAGRKICIAVVQFNCEIRIYCGLDCVWSAVYKRPAAEKAGTDKEFLLKISAYKGDLIPVPHALGSIANKFIDCPELCCWLRTRIRQGAISHKALNALKDKIMEDKSNA